MSSALNLSRPNFEAEDHVLWLFNFWNSPGRLVISSTHSLYLCLHPLFPGKSESPAGLLACLVLSCKLGKGTFPPGRGSPAEDLTWQRQQGLVFCRTEDEFEPPSGFGRKPWSTVVGSGSLLPLCCPQATHVSAVLLGDDYPAESYWVEQVLTERRSSTLGTA